MITRAGQDGKVSLCKMEVVGLYIDQTKDFNYSMVFVTLTYQTLTLHVLISL